nr:hypothetical protein [Tanacetum cinerariifolium]
VQVLEDREAVASKPSGEDAPIKGRSKNEEEAAAERITTVLAGETNVPTGSGFIPTVGLPATVISTGSEVGPTASLIIRRRKGKEVMVESNTPKKKKLQEQIDAQLVPVEDVYVQALQVKHPISDWKVNSEGERSYWQIIRLGGSSVCYQFFVDILRQLDREDLNQLWALVKEYLSIRPASSDKEIELWVELKRMYEPDPEDQLWTLAQNYMHAPVEWKLYDLSGVHH